MSDLRDGPKIDRPIQVKGSEDNIRYNVHQIVVRHCEHLKISPCINNSKIALHHLEERERERKRVIEREREREGDRERENERDIETVIYS